MKIEIANAIELLVVCITILLLISISLYFCGKTEKKRKSNTEIAPPKKRRKPGDEVDWNAKYHCEHTSCGMPFYPDVYGGDAKAKQACDRHILSVQEHLPQCKNLPCFQCSQNGWISCAHESIKRKADGLGVKVAFDSSGVGERLSTGRRRVSNSTPSGSSNVHNNSIVLYNSGNLSSSPLSIKIPQTPKSSTPTISTSSSSKLARGRTRVNELDAMTRMNELTGSIKLILDSMPHNSSLRLPLLSFIINNANIRLKDAKMFFNISNATYYRAKNLDYDKAIEIITVDRS